MKMLFVQRPRIWQLRPVSLVAAIWVFLGIANSVFACTQSCTPNFDPDVCLGTIGVAYNATGFTTAGKREQDTYNCGTKDTTLLDVMFLFTPSVSGTYQIFTETTDDTTMQLEYCDTAGTVIACNDDRSATDTSSFLQQPLTAGTQYIIGVSKRSSSLPEVTFGLAIILVTPAPTSVAPTSKAPTKQPTSVAPTSVAPTQQPTTLAPVGGSGPATNPPTSLQSTSSPTSGSGTNGAGNPPAADNNSMTIGIGGGIGGVVALALGVALGKRTIDRRRRSAAAAVEVWAPDEEERLRAAFHSTHDINALYAMFPHRSRESVAMKTRQILQSQPRPMQPQRTAKSTYLFVKERTRAVTSKFWSKPPLPPASSLYEHDYPATDNRLYQHQFSSRAPVSSFVDY